MIDRLLLSLAVATANVDRLSRSVQPRVVVLVTCFDPDGARACRVWWGEGR